MSDEEVAADDGQGFRAITERWTVPRIERVVALLRKGDREALSKYLDSEVPRVAHTSDPEGLLDLKGIPFDRVGYRVDLGQVTLDRLNLWSSRLVNVNLKGAKFENCLGALSVFENAYLRSVSFVDCDLHGCMFRQCHLGDVRLTRTKLRFSDWRDCELDVSTFANGVDEVDRGRWALARDVYKALRLNLSAMGDEPGAGWAAYQQSVMERRRRWDARHRVQWFFSLIVDLVWGYGHKPSRLFAASIGFCMLFAALYCAVGLKVGPVCQHVSTAPDGLSFFGESVYYSFVTFTTLDPGDLGPCDGIGRTLTVIEAFVGIFMLGLFVTANVRKLEGR